MDFRICFDVRKRYLCLFIEWTAFPLDLHTGWIASLIYAVIHFLLCARLYAQRRLAGTTSLHNLKTMCAQRGTTSQPEVAEQFLRGTTFFGYAHFLTYIFVNTTQFVEQE